MEQPQANPTFCPQNCGFYGSSQFGGMCSKCFQENVKQRSAANQALNSSPSNSYYAASNMPVTSSSSQTPSSFPTSSPPANDVTQQEQSSLSNDQDEVVGRMDEDNEPPAATTVMSVEQSSSPSSTNAASSEQEEKPMEEEEQCKPTLGRPISHVQTEPTLPIAIPASMPISASAIFGSASLGAESMSPSTCSASTDTKKKKCTTCKKRVGLTGFDCRCGGHFCSLHRYPNEHSCQFDYKVYERKRLDEALQPVIASKVEKI